MSWSEYCKFQVTPWEKCPETYTINPKINDKVSLWQGDIRKLEADAIVNSANITLLGGGGIDGLIHEAAGPELLEECKTLSGCKVGGAKLTKGYNLPAKKIIHTVGPHKIKKDADLLESAYKSCLQLAMDKRIRTIAFPSISTGVHQFPQEDAAEIALRTVRHCLETHRKKFDRIIFATYLDSDFRIYERLMQKYFPVE